MRSLPAVLASPADAIEDSMRAMLPERFVCSRAVLGHQILRDRTMDVSPFILGLRGSAARG